MANMAASVFRAAGSRSAVAVAVGLPSAFVVIPQMRRFADLNATANGQSPVLPGDMTARYAGMVERMSVGTSPAITHASQQSMDKLMMTNSVVQANEHKLRKTRSQAGVDGADADTLKRTQSLKFKRSGKLDRHGATSYTA